ncbi:hypothetical protein METP3_02367 [Methanosarcinales archaeon]|nr:hypothetical protein METP3_02367 [Methanosarcinales archaeon]
MEVRNQPLVFFTAILIGLAASNIEAIGNISVLIIPSLIAIAVVAFPDRPLISLSLVLAQLIEIPVLLLLSKVLPLWEKYGYAN